MSHVRVKSFTNHDGLRYQYLRDIIPAGTILMGKILLSLWIRDAERLTESDCDKTAEKEFGLFSSLVNMFGKHRLYQSYCWDNEDEPDSVPETSARVPRFKNH